MRVVRVRMTPEAQLCTCAWTWIQALLRLRLSAAHDPRNPTKCAAHFPKKIIKIIFEVIFCWVINIFINLLINLNCYKINRMILAIFIGLERSKMDFFGKNHHLGIMFPASANNFRLTSKLYRMYKKEFSTRFWVIRSRVEVH